MTDTLVTCPVCNGSGKVPLPEDQKHYTWNKGKTDMECQNCGGQTMSGKASGRVRARPDGTPCVHEYSYQSIGRCLHLYTCKHCKMSYQIDSGD